MSATTATPVTLEPARRPRLTFAGVLKSELIKLVTVRSTVWCLAIALGMSIGLAFLVASTLPADEPASSYQDYWTLTATLGLNFSQLVIAILGVLVITSEYSTGMIRSTFAAVPRRLPALAAKAIVIGVTSFVVAVIAVLASAILPLGLLQGVGITPDLTDADAWLVFLGGAVYLALIALLSMAIGAIVRNSAGAIAAALGLILMVPTVLQIIAGITRGVWALNVSAFLPTDAGGRLFTYPTADQFAPPGVLILEPWQGLLVLMAWVSVALIAAAALTKKRDI